MAITIDGQSVKGPSRHKKDAEIVLLGQPKEETGKRFFFSFLTRTQEQKPLKDMSAVDNNQQSLFITLAQSTEMGRLSTNKPERVELDLFSSLLWLDYYVDSSHPSPIYLLFGPRT